MKRRIIAMLMCLVLMIGIMPVTALAVDVIASGKCGDNVTWELDKFDTLTITGSGEMYDYGIFIDIPWYGYSSNIKSIIIEDGVTNVCDDAFQDCKNLVSVTISDSVKSIGEYAFAWCDSLKKVNISENVTYIGDWAFNNCKRLTGIWVDSNNPNYSSDEYGVLFNKNKTELIQAPGGITGNYSIPAGVTYIGDWAFVMCNNLSGITISDGVTDIEEFAVSDCDNLKSVTISESVRSIGRAAFVGNSKLEGIWVDEANEYYCSDARGVLYSKDKSELVLAPTGITGSYLIPDSVKIICDNAFDYCVDLAEVTIPDSVQSIGMEAFSYCGRLTNIVIPGSVKNIGHGTFGNCYNLTSVIMEDGVISLSDFAFTDCSSLISVRIPSSVTSIGAYAFDGCNDLEKALYAGSLNDWSMVFVDYGNECLLDTVTYMLQGDIDGDGKLTNADLVKIARIIVGLD